MCCSFKANVPLYGIFDGESAYQISVNTTESEQLLPYIGGLLGFRLGVCVCYSKV